MTTKIILISSSENGNKNVTHDLTLSNKNEAFFEVEQTKGEGFFIKLFLSNVYLTLDKHIKSKYIEFINLKLDTVDEKLEFIMCEDNICCNIDEEWYFLKIVNLKLCLVPHLYQDHKYFDKYNSQLYKSVFLNSKDYYNMEINTDIQKTLNEYLIRRFTDSEIDETDGNEIHYNFDDIINVILVYNNCRSYAFIIGIAEYSPPILLELIDKLGLKCIPNYDSEEMFITKINTKIEKYSSEDRGKKLGYMSYMYNDWNDKSQKRISSGIRLKIDSYPDDKIQIGPTEVFNVKHSITDDIEKYYKKISKVYSIVLNGYIHGISLKNTLKEF